MVLNAVRYCIAWGDMTLTLCEFSVIAGCEARQCSKETTAIKTLLEDWLLKQNVQIICDAANMFERCVITEGVEHSYISSESGLGRSTERLPDVSS
jgi:hypothetical protein